MKLIASSGSRKAKMHLRSIKGFEKNYKIKFPSKQLNIKNFYLTTKNYISPDREEGGIWGPKGGGVLSYWPPVLGIPDSSQALPMLKAPL